jgi:hypothetical protein
MTLSDKIVALHYALARTDVPHAFGGALALAWCTERARGTIDIDLNIFVDHTQARVVRDALPPEVACRDEDQVLLERDGQIRLWWGTTPVDIFLNTTAFHLRAAARVRWEDFGGTQLPFLDCSDLAVFKAFFNRTKDWADLEDMAAAGTLDLDQTLGVLLHHLDTQDPRIERLRALGGG